MLNFKQYAVTATFTFCILLLLYAAYYVGALPIPVEVWDNVATVGWSTLPAMMCYVLLQFSLNMREYSTAKVALIDSQAELNSSLADKAEADTWSIRAHTKAFRNQN